MNKQTVLIISDQYKLIYHRSTTETCCSSVTWTNCNMWGNAHSLSPSPPLFFFSLSSSSSPSQVNSRCFVSALPGFFPSTFPGPVGLGPRVQTDSPPPNRNLTHVRFSHFPSIGLQVFSFSTAVYHEQNETFEIIFVTVDRRRSRSVWKQNCADQEFFGNKNPVISLTSCQSLQLQSDWNGVTAEH